MSKKLISISEEQLQFAVGLTEFALRQLNLKHDESYSGVDKLLYTTWIVSAEELLETLKAKNAQNEPETLVEDIERPEA